MALRSDGARTKKRILSSSVRLFLENGYHHTTLQQIYNDANVSASSFQNLFGSKDGILMELMQFMYENQFDIAIGMTNNAGRKLPPIYVYSIETCIQLTLTELNESIRECYVESYTYHETMDYVHHRTAGKLYEIFGPYQPELTENDFYVLDFGTAGMMRGYMANPCSGGVTLEKKLNSFLSLALRGFKVPENEVQQVLAFIGSIDIRSIAQKVLDQLFRQLAMHYDFSLSGILPESGAHQHDTR